MYVPIIFSCKCSHTLFSQTVSLATNSSHKHVLSMKSTVSWLACFSGHIIHQRASSSVAVHSGCLVAAWQLPCCCSSAPACPAPVCLHGVWLWSLLMEMKTRCSFTLLKQRESGRGEREGAKEWKRNKERTGKKLPLTCILFMSLTYSTHTDITTSEMLLWCHSQVVFGQEPRTKPTRLRHAIRKKTLYSPGGYSFIHTELYIVHYAAC